MSSCLLYAAAAVAILAILAGLSYMLLDAMDTVDTMNDENQHILDAQKLSDAEHAKDLQEYASKVMILQVEVTDLSNINKELRSVNCTLEINQIRSDDEHAEHTQALLEHPLKVARLQAHIMDLDKANKEFRLANNLLLNSLSCKMEECQALKLIHHNCSERIENLTEGVKNLQDQQSFNITIVQSFKDQLSTKDAELASIAKELQTTKTDLGHATAKTEERDNRISDLEFHIGDLNDHIFQSTGIIEDLHLLREKNELSIAQCILNLDKQDAEITSLRQNTAATVHALSGQVAELVASEKALFQQNVQLERQLNELDEFEVRWTEDLIKITDLVEGVAARAEQLAEQQERACKSDEEAEAAEKAGDTEKAWETEKADKAETAEKAAEEDEEEQKEHHWTGDSNAGEIGDDENFEERCLAQDWVVGDDEWEDQIASGDSVIHCEYDDDDDNTESRVSGEGENENEV